MFKSWGAFLPIFAIAFFMAVGIVCLVWPDKIQDLAIKSNVKFGKFNLLSDWVKTSAYNLSVRIIGGALLAALLIAYVLMIKK